MGLVLWIPGVGFWPAVWTALGMLLWSPAGAWGLPRGISWAWAAPGCIGSRPCSAAAGSPCCSPFGGNESAPFFKNKSSWVAREMQGLLPALPGVVVWSQEEMGPPVPGAWSLTGQGWAELP